MNWDIRHHDDRETVGQWKVEVAKKLWWWWGRCRTCCCHVWLGSLKCLKAWAHTCVPSRLTIPVWGDLNIRRVRHSSSSIVLNSDISDYTRIQLTLYWHFTLVFYCSKLSCVLSHPHVTVFSERLIEECAQKVFCNATLIWVMFQVSFCVP
jgi:hypothetical protein